jgi:hypothetical protein
MQLQNQALWPEATEPGEGGQVPPLFVQEENVLFLWNKSAALFFSN